MEIWIPVTIAAAFAQNMRFMLQKHLKSTQLSTGGATFARFIYAAPFVAIIAFSYGQLSGQPMPSIPNNFWPFALIGGIAQILATMCVVAIFAHRNFAVGITFKKTEVLMAVLVGLIVLGEGVTRLGFVAILVGLAGVLLLSDQPDQSGAWFKRIVNKAAGLGLTSGVLFAISGVGYRGASLSLGSGDTFLRAVTTLACVTAFQTLAMALWLFWRERSEIGKVLRAWRIAIWVGLSGMIGSICWFVAFTLQTVAYVKALGQIELVFSFLASAFVFKEKTTRKEAQGVGLIVVSILILIYAL